MKLIKEIPGLKNKNVLVMGLGLFGGGVGLTKFLAKQGAKVSVTDLKDEHQLADSLRQLAGLPVEFHLAGHREIDFKNADIVFVNPAVAPSSPFIKIAEENKVPLETEMNLFFKLCKSRKIIGITGTHGKSTTTTLIGEILKSQYKNVWVGGNIGGSLLEDVEKIKEEDFVVLELSSFQLENLAQIEKSPEVAVVLNIFPNHLDRHGTFSNYIRAKQVIVQFQTRSAIKILNFDDEVIKEFAHSGMGQCYYFSIKEELKTGAFASGNFIKISLEKVNTEIDISNRLLPGIFNIQNMCASALACYMVAEPSDYPALAQYCSAVFNSFKGLEHRMQFVKEVNGVRFYNNSIATTPSSAIAGLDTFDRPVILIAGGYDKKLSYEEFARKVAEKTKALILIGQTAQRIGNLVKMERQDIPIIYAFSLEEAVNTGYKLASPGDVVLLSPACASYDMFSNFVERGNKFMKAVNRLQ